LEAQSCQCVEVARDHAKERNLELYFRLQLFVSCFVILYSVKTTI
jgi:hypothetical protein